MRKLPIALAATLTIFGSAAGAQERARQDGAASTAATAAVEASAAEAKSLAKTAMDALAVFHPELSQAMANFFAPAPYAEDGLPGFHEAGRLTALAEEYPHLHRVLADGTFDSMSMEEKYLFRHRAREEVTGREHPPPKPLNTEVRRGLEQKSPHILAQTDALRTKVILDGFRELDAGIKVARALKIDYETMKGLAQDDPGHPKKKTDSNGRKYAGSC